MKKSTKVDQSLPAETRPEQVTTQTKSTIDFARRAANRALDIDSLLNLLRNDAPRLFELAEIVGKWVWLTFPEKQPADITRAVSEFGFHWNNARQTWQHPCGSIPTEREAYDPRKRYKSYLASAQQAA